MGLRMWLQTIGDEGIAEVRADPEQLVQVREQHEHTADLDKAWHGIHYLLTQTAWEGEPPLDFLLRGPAFGPDDVAGLAAKETIDALASHGHTIFHDTSGESRRKYSRCHPGHAPSFLLERLLCDLRSGATCIHPLHCEMRGPRPSNLIPFSLQLKNER